MSVDQNVLSNAENRDSALSPPFLSLPDMGIKENVTTWTVCVKIAMLSVSNATMKQHLQVWVLKPRTHKYASNDNIDHIAPRQN